MLLNSDEGEANKQDMDVAWNYLRNEYKILVLKGRDNC
jgi:hypothetical protein